MPAPTRIAKADIAAPSRRWTRSRSTSATPTIITPDGAITPGATGTTHGPCGAMHAVPTWPISQLAAGMVSANRTRKIVPSRLR